MKKITFLMCLLVSTLGFSQVVLEDFESSYPSSDLEAFEGASGATIVADPAPGGTNGQVLEIVSEASGNPWQGASMLLQSNYVDLTTDKAIQVDIYSDDSFGMLLKVENGQTGPDSAGDNDTNVNYVGGSGWQTITVTLNQNLDMTSTADGEYGKIVFFPGWDNAADGWASCCNPGVGTANTIYIDNIRGVQGSAIGGGGSLDLQEDFETLPTDQFTGFEGLGGANIVADPASGGTNGQVGEIISSSAGQPWQGAQLLMQSNYMDLTTNITVEVDVYSVMPLTLFAKVEDNVASVAPDSAADEPHTGSGWETLTFTFNESLDMTVPANGEYSQIAFFPNWNGSGFNDPAGDFTIYVDNIRATTGSAIAAPEPDPAAAPIPTSSDGETYSIYNDTNAYSTFLVFDYDFGSVAGEPDLDPGAGENKALKFDFSVAGYGVGEGGPDDVSSYNFVSFDYFARAGIPGFRFVMISNDGGVTEHNYEIGVDEAVVNEQWTKVVIPMSFFTNLGFSDTNFWQWKMDPFMQDPGQGGVVYVDNILLTQGNPLSVDGFETTEFKAFPNPTNNNWNISGSTTIQTTTVYDILGKQVMALKPNSNSFVIEASSLKTGVYFARLESDNGSKTIKLVRQ
ncbi:T9SS type A sorting domain-containing protein [Winogradskyella sp. MIT101101]|uniref:T9SS type A sorting domain-containing protein n=1 Tax=Winogradskyella sp. MIT101101 TaxID=3098297 RepID=UPI00399BAF41